MENNEQIVRIKTYLALINKDYQTIVQQNPDLIDFVILETIERLMFYLNCTALPEQLERISAEIINGSLKRILDNKANDGSEKGISSMSDNGQSITFSSDVKKYFTTATDDEMFSGYVGILNRYRRIKVVC